MSRPRRHRSARPGLTRARTVTRTVTMTGTIPLTVAVTVVAALAGCSPAESPPPTSPPMSTAPDVPTGPSPTTAGKAPILVNAVEPARALLPASIPDEYGRRIGALIYRGLLRYDAKGRLVSEVAEDVTQESPLLYRVKLRKDWSFGNGELVTAASFVDAWNYAASPACGQLYADAFAPIAGYRSLRGLPEPTPPPEATRTTTSAPTPTRPGSAAGAPSGTASSTTPPATSAVGTEPSNAAGAGACPAAARGTLTGLQVVDDLEFTIRLALPDATFRDRLASLPYVPLPRVALTDPVSFATAPVGNGPYQLAGGWFAGKEIRLIPNPSYLGGDPAHNGGVTFRFFPDPAMTYPALREGQLEMLDEMPITALHRFKADLGFRALNQPIGATSSLVFPVHRSEWTTPEGLLLRRAISRSIDRKALADGLYAGTRTPATDLVTPGVAGYAPDLCGDDCRYDPAAAAGLLPDKAAVPPLQIAYDPEVGGLPAVEALCTAVTDALGISCEPLAVPRDPATGTTLEMLAARHEVTVPMLSVRRMARPDISGFLVPRFLAGSNANPSGYAGATAQALFVTAAATTAADTRTNLYRDAQKLILADLPEIPLWYVNATTGAGVGMQQVRIDAFGVPIYTELNRS